MASGLGLLILKATSTIAVVPIKLRSPDTFVLSIWDSSEVSKALKNSIVWRLNFQSWQGCKQ
jgi:hypothetical protein